LEICVYYVQSAVCCSRCFSVSGDFQMLIGPRHPTCFRREIKMRKLIIALAALTLAITLSSSSAKAQTGLTLSANSSGTITFAANGASVTMSSLAGSVTGSGALTGTNGFYSISGPSVTLTLISSLPTVFAEYNASGIVNFDISTGPGGSGTTLLKGTLSLVDLEQASSIGITDPVLNANLTVTGGSLSGAGEPFALGAGSGVGVLTLDLSGVGYLPTSSGGRAALESGSFDPTPEPTSMLLFGSGVLAFGIILRRRLIA
jgi:hypothetical protein